MIRKHCRKYPLKHSSPDLSFGEYRTRNFISSLHVHCSVGCRHAVQNCRHSNVLWSNLHSLRHLAFGTISAYLHSSFRTRTESFIWCNSIPNLYKERFSENTCLKCFDEKSSHQAENLKMQPFLSHPPCWCSLFHCFIQYLSFQFQMFHTGSIWSQARLSLIRHLSVFNYPPTFQWPLTLTSSKNEALVSTWTDNSKVVMRDQVYKLSLQSVDKHGNHLQTTL